MKKVIVGAGLCALAAAGSIVAGPLMASADAAVSPRTATNCSWVGTNYGGTDPHYYGFKATCTDTPTGQWRLVLNCTSYAGKTAVVNGNTITGSGTSFATCAGTNWEVDGITIQNLV